MGFGETSKHPAQSFSFSQLTNEANWVFEGAAVYLNSANQFENQLIYSPGFSFGYVLKGQYNFNESKNVSITLFNYGNDINNRIDHINNLFNEGSTPINTDFDENLYILNLSLSHDAYFANQIIIKFLGGLQYFHLRRSIRRQLTTNNSASTVDYDIKTSADGIGPRVGLGLDFRITEPLRIFVNLAYSSLSSKIGRNVADIEYIDRRQVPELDKSIKLSSEDKGPIGGKEAELGVNYATHYLEGKLNLKAGVLGIAFAVADSKFGGFFLGAEWLGNG